MSRLPPLPGMALPAGHGRKPVPEYVFVSLAFLKGQKFMPAPAPAPVPLKSDLLFKRLITWSTAVCLAGSYGWLASYERQADGGLHFHWRWLSLFWIVIGVGSSNYFWHQAWPPPGYPAATRKSIIKGLIVFILPGLWWLIYPLRFLSGQRFWDVITSLMVVVLALSFGAWMITRLVKAFEASDAYDLNELDTEEHMIETDQAEK
ncbi:MAG: hypothetical protein ABSE48_09755 [Verrucomicrobiota bacterium]